jgi:DNA-binding response OmpR family regulator
MSHDPPRLLVDDDVDICRNLGDILTDLGYRMDMPQDGASALELVRQRPYDDALVDPDAGGGRPCSLLQTVRRPRAARKAPGTGPGAR